MNQAGTTTSLVSAINPSVSGQPVTFTVTVMAAAPASGTPTGTVSFFDGTTSLGTAALQLRHGQLHRQGTADRRRLDHGVLRWERQFHAQHLAGSRPDR